MALTTTALTTRARSLGGSLFGDCLDYETSKAVVIRDKVVGLVYRLLQLAIISYFLGWVFLTQKAYQSFEKVTESSVISKVKGVEAAASKSGQMRVWDVAEYVTPPQGGSSFCIVTNVLETPRQMLGTCAEKKKVPGAKCTNVSDCKAGQTHLLGSGVKTGRCVPLDDEHKTCEVMAWCPLESGYAPRKPMLAAAENFTIMIKNSITFGRFKVERSNMKDDVNKSYLQNCLHDPIRDNYCPIFRLGDVVTRAGQDFEKLAAKGGVLGILIQWICDLDQGAAACNPKYSFERLDKVPPLSDLSSGYNFRYAEKHVFPNGTEFRYLYKIYGIRIDVLVSGEAGRFDVVPTLINIASALTSIGVGSVICDFILLNITKHRQKYRQHKVEEVEIENQKGLVN
uniref:P2X purinoceptor 5-like isoform X1 n=1 Tax=Myxine glutinosa TaxID=7769 RepID=UPI00358DE7B5